MWMLLPFIASLFCTTFPTTTTIPLPSGSTLNFTVNLNNIQEARASNSNVLTRPQCSSASDTPLLDKLTTLWTDPDTKQTLVNRLGKNTGSFISEYKWSLILGTLATGYAYCCYIIASGNHYLERKELWSSWRHDLTFEQLLSIPQTQLAKELLQEIQRRYTDAASLTDIVRPLGVFVKVIEEEEQQLQWYQNAYSWIEYLKIGALIPMRAASFAKITERLQRIAYLKNAFHTWAAHYQLEQVSKSMQLWETHDIPDVSYIAALMAYHYKISVLNYLTQKQLRINQ